LLPAYYHKDRREAKNDDCFYGNCVGLPFERQSLVTAKIPALYAFDKKLDEYESSYSCRRKKKSKFKLKIVSISKYSKNLFGLSAYPAGI
jgi:hypothetical protein